MLPVASIARTYQQTLTGTPTALAIPTTDVDYAALMLYSPTPFYIQFNASDAPFYVPGNVPFQLPVQRSAGTLVSDASGATLSIMALGYGGRFKD